MNTSNNSTERSSNLKCNCNHARAFGIGCSTTSNAKIIMLEWSWETRMLCKSRLFSKQISTTLTCWKMDNRSYMNLDDISLVWALWHRVSELSTFSCSVDVYYKFIYNLLSYKKTWIIVQYSASVNGITINHATSLLHMSHFVSCAEFASIQWVIEMPTGILQTLSLGLHSRSQVLSGMLPCASFNLWVSGMELLLLRAGE